MTGRLRDARHVTYVRACERKAKYKSEAVARDYGQRCIERGQVPGGKLWPYPCPTCRCWHLTHTMCKIPAITREQKREGFH